ncbi:Gti1/Pac2 family-domain-containing protein [Mycena latifolia]|nr:Gti1/Pac2 family-domain-containing protein [Mycena latifolia]
MDKSMCRPEITSCVTHAALHIRDINDAHLVFEAVRLKILPLIKRRLVPYERAQLRSGNVFVWEESETEDGLVRWTEGRRWSQSRMRGDCLFYEEKIETTLAEKQAKAARRAMKASESSEPIPAPPKRKDRPFKADGLTKQTYSVTVQTPGAGTLKRWHIVAYFSAGDVSCLPVVDDYAYLRNIRVPSGVFLRTSRPVGGNFDRFPQPLEMPGSTCPSSTQGSPSPVIEPRVLEPPLGAFSPSPQFSTGPPVVLPPISPAHPPTTLPSLSLLGYPSAPHEYFPAASRIVPHRSKAIRADDRRILDRFRVVV